MTRQRGWHAVGAVTAHSLDQALGIAELAPDGDQVWVIGGGDLYQQALPRTERAEITEIDTVVDGDTFAPALDPSVWLCTSSHAAEWLTSTGPQALRYRFDTLTRH